MGQNDIYSVPNVPAQESAADAAAYCTAVQCTYDSYASFIANPLLQAGQALLGSVATIAILEYQKGQYDDVASEQRDIIDAAVGNYCNAVDECINSQAFEEAYPDVPAAAEYVPVVACDEYSRAMQCICDTIQLSETTANKVDQAQIRNSLARIIALNPKYQDEITLFTCQVQDLLNGKLSIGDTLEVTTDAAENAYITGRIGNSCKRTARFLGISQMRAQERGRQSMQQMIAMLARDISPINRQLDLTTLVLTPAQVMGLALTQAQLIQQSLQNRFNQEAIKSPHLIAELQSKFQKIVATLQHEASKANLVNQFVPNYAGILQPQISQLSSFAAGTATNFGSGVGGDSLFQRGTAGFPLLGGI